MQRERLPLDTDFVPCRHLLFAWKSCMSPILFSEWGPQLCLLSLGEQRWLHLCPMPFSERWLCPCLLSLGEERWLCLCLFLLSEWWLCLCLSALSDQLACLVSTLFPRHPACPDLITPGGRTTSTGSSSFFARPWALRGLLPYLYSLLCHFLNRKYAWLPHGSWDIYQRCSNRQIFKWTGAGGWQWIL